MDITAQFGGFKSRLVHHEATGELGHILEQPERKKILERNKELRKNPDAVQDLSYGRCIASIPLEDYEYFKRTNPGYYQMDKAQRQKCLMNFLKFDPRGQACMIQDTQYKTKTKYHEVIK